MEPLHLDVLRDVAGLGVAGNFAGHLEQAGEAADFAGVPAGEGEAPKGVFPWYVPGHPSFLGTFPLSHDRIELPPADEPLNLQIEPEVGLLCDVVRDPDGQVAALRPRVVAAFNDCSIRRPGAPKISHKKNWGSASKGVAARGFAVEEIDPGGATAGLRLSCWLRRAGEASAYGVDSPLPGYTYYGARLLDWLVDRLAGQRGGDGTPLEDVGALWREAPAPVDRVLVGIGATRYTAVGETTFLRAGDESIVVVADSAVAPPEAVAEAVAAGREDELPGASVLRQLVVDAAR